MLLAPAVVALLAHPRALGVGWLWDDHQLLEALASRGLGDVIAGAFLDEYVRPLVMLTLGLESRTGDSTLTHAINLGLHAVASVGLAWWLRGEGISQRAATLAASLWAALPVHTEVVLWASARGDLLCAVAAVVGLGAVTRGGARSAVVAGLCALVAALSLERGLMVAPALALRAVWGRPLRPALPTIAACGSAVVVWIGLRLGTLGSLGESEYVIQGFGRVPLALAGLASATTRSLWPLSPDLAVGVHAPPGAHAIAVGALTAVALGLLLGRGRGRPALAVSLWLILLLPTLHVVPLEVFPLHADRYLYVPWIGVALLLSVGLDALPPPRTGLGTIAMGALIGLGALTSAARGGIWLDEGTLFAVMEREAEVGNGQPTFVLAGYLIDRGRCDLAVPRYRDARLAFEAQGRTINASRARARIALCSAPLDPVAAAGELAAAAEVVREAWLLEGWAVALLVAGDADAADAVAASLEREHPEDPRGPSCRSRIAASQLAFDDAIAALDRARGLAGGIGPSALRDRLVAARDVTAVAEAASDQPALDALRAAWAASY